MRTSHWISLLILTADVGPCFAAGLGKASGEGAMSRDIEWTPAADRFKPRHADARKETHGARQQTLIYLFDREAPAGQWTDADNRESAIADRMIDNMATVVSGTSFSAGRSRSGSTQETPHSLFL